jgi:hypothetical protein
MAAGGTLAEVELAQYGRAPIPDEADGGHFAPSRRQGGLL